MKKPPTITNVHVEPPQSYGATRTFAGFNFNGARYHVWFDMRKPGENDQTRRALYKNVDATSSKAGTRYLDPTVGKNAALLAEMWRQIKEQDLIAKALEIVQAKEDKRLAEIEAERAAARVRNAGPKLLAALKALWNDPDGDDVELVKMVEAAIAEAEGHPPTDEK